MAKVPTEGDPPSLEEMGHQGLVDLAKKLLEERASKPTLLKIPNKDATVAGHFSMNQESFVQSIQAILQGLAEGGYIHAKPPKFESVLVMTRKTSWILIFGRYRSCLQLQPILGQLLNKQ